MTEGQLQAIKNCLEKSKKVNSLINDQQFTAAYNLNLEVWKELENVAESERLKNYLK